jgi:hypothetical protein
VDCEALRELSHRRSEPVRRSVRLPQATLVFAHHARGPEDNLSAPRRDGRNEGSMKSLSQVLIERLDRIASLLDELLAASTIDYEPDRKFRIPGIVVMTLLPDSIWGPPDDRQRSLQRELLELWTPWLEQVTLLFSEDTERRREELRDAAAKIRLWIERNERDFSVPPTIRQASAVLREHLAPLYKALHELGSAPSRVMAVPDTNVLLRSQELAQWRAVLGVDAFVVVLVPGVLAELDAHKLNHRNEKVRERARKFSDRIKGWLNQGDVATGVRVEGDVRVRVEGREPNLARSLSWLDPNVADDRILASLLELQRRDPAARVVLLTGDSIMLAKAAAACVPTTDTPDPDP